HSIECFPMRLLTILLAVPFFGTDSYKILVYNSKFGHSHSTFLGQIADILVDAGHNVTSLLPILDTSLRDGTEKSHKIHVQPDPVVKAFYENQEAVNFFDMDMFSPIAPFIVSSMFANNFGRTCKRVVEEPGLIEKLRSEQFDVMITENYDICGIGISHAIAPKSVIAATSTFLFGPQFNEFGVETAVSYRHSLVMPSFDVHSFSSRIWNAISEFVAFTMFRYPRYVVDGVLKERFGPDYPSITKQSGDVAYVLTNSDPLMDSAAPTLARVIEIPGIGAKIPKKLNEYWEAILNRRSRTVLISFGSVAKSVQMPAASKAGILSAIRRFPEVTFIWKYEQLDDEFCSTQASTVSNLVMADWVPQVDILNHANLSLFITHSGMGSTRETASLGVPGVFVPLFFDQPRNAAMMELNGLGRVFDKFKLHDADKFMKTIREVLENAKYKENAVRLSKMLANKPFSSQALLVKHVEFAAEFGASEALKPQSLNMNIIEYLNLDIMALIGFVIFVVVYFIVFVLRATFIVRKHKIE
ncbi:hypothetical protein PFISCL1PPCAC_14029, partial [Pristionchus fissidentatus]